MRSRIGRVPGSIPGPSMAGRCLGSTESRLLAQGVVQFRDRPIFFFTNQRPWNEDREQGNSARK